MRLTRLAVAIHEAGHAVIQLADPPAPYIDSISITGIGEGLAELVDTPRTVGTLHGRASRRR